MKIVICVHNLANGGAERVASLWANGFAADENTVYVLTCEENAPVNYLLSPNVTVYDISEAGNPLVRYVKKVINLRRELKNIRPDVVLTVLHPWNVWSIIAKIGLDIPIINTEHDCFERPPKAPLKKSIWFEKFILNRFFRVVTVLNHRDKELLNKYMNNVEVLPNPLTFKVPHKIIEKEKIILAAGRIDDWYCKGFDLLIKSWSKIAKQYPDWTLCVAGNDKRGGREILEDIIEEEKVKPQVKLLGFCEDILLWLQKVDVFVLSSRYEGFGMVLLEAMSQGCACVSCDYHGRQSEIITDGMDGIVCGCDNEEELSACLNRVLSDKELRNKLRENAIKRASDYAIDKIMDNWYQIFRKYKILTT